MLSTILSIKTLALYKAVELQIYFAAACSNKPKFLGFPSWYHYLPKRNPEVGLTGERTCSPHIGGINDVWLIGLAVVEILLRIAVLAAILFVMVGGLKYVNSRGNAEKTESAKKTLTDALIGLVIAVSATAVVSFIGGRFS